MEYAEKNLKRQEATYQFFVKKGLIKQNKKGQVFPIFTHNLKNQPPQTKFLELNISPNRPKQPIKNNSVNNSISIAQNIPRKNTAYQYYIDGIMRKRKNTQPQIPKITTVTRTVEEIKGEHLELLKDNFLPKLYCLRNEPTKFRFRHSLPKQDIYTEPNPEVYHELQVADSLKPWEDSQKSFIMN